MNSPDWLEHFHSCFSSSSPLAKQNETFFGNLFVQRFLNLQYRVGCFVKIIWNNQRPNFVSAPSIYKIPWEEKNQKLLAINKFYAIVNLEFIEVNGKYCTESKNVEALVDQIGQNTKNELFPHKMSHIQLYRASPYWWKEAKVIFLEVLLSTTESYMVITNILKTIN